MTNQALEQNDNNESDCILENEEDEEENSYYAYFLQQGHEPYHWYPVEPYEVEEMPHLNYEEYWIGNDFSIEDALADLNNEDE